ncbi:MAG: glycosyltransferase family A protein [Bdellovibrionales bacterium]
MDAKRCTVSVSVVAYNEQSRIFRCLMSLKRQSNYQDIDQIIIIDNCSTDNTSAKIIDFIQEHGDEKWSFYRTNINALGDSRNFALKQVRDSRWITYVDADSYLPENWLANHIKNFQKISKRGLKVGAVGGVISYQIPIW